MQDRSNVERLVEQVEEAFGAEPIVPIREFLAEKYKTSDDGHEAAAVLGAQPWTELETKDLFYHREALGMLSAAAYPGILAAFVRASLLAGRSYAPDLLRYAVSSLGPLSNDNDDIAEARQRLARLSAEQRHVVGLYLRYLVDEFDDADAAQILTSWSSNPDGNPPRLS